MNTRPGLLGRKVGMTQLFAENGDLIGVTVIEVGPNAVVQVKNAAGKDGYTAVQLGFGEQKAQRLTKAERGHLAKTNAPASALLKEIRLDEASLALYPLGETVQVGTFFSAGQLVDVAGVSKGRGTAGVMKRYHFAGFESSHGTHEFFRHGGSIGTRLTPGMTFRGKRMGGHLGDDAVTMQNLPVIRVDAERNLLYVHGAVPGATGGFVTVRQAVRTRKVPKNKK